MLDLLLALFCPSVAGILCSLYCLRRYERGNIFEHLVFGFGLGMGFLTFSMFLLGLLHIRFSVPAVMAVQAVIVLVLSVLIFRSEIPFRTMLSPCGRLPFDKGEPLSRTGKAVISVFLIWIIVKFVFVIHESSLVPVFTWDSFTNWSLGGKFFFYERGLNLNVADEHFFGWGNRAMLGYPLHNFMMEVWVSLWKGSFDEVYAKFWNVFYFFGVVVLIFLALRQVTSALLAVLFAFFLSSSPLLTFHALDAYADMTTSFYTLAAAVCFWRFIEVGGKERHGGKGLLLLMGLFASMALWTKLEGLMFLLSFSAALAVFVTVNRIPFRDLRFFIAPVLLVAGTWYSFLRINHIPLMYHGDKAQAAFRYDAIPLFFSQILVYPHFNIIFVVLGGVLILGWKSLLRSGEKYLLAVLFSVMLMFLYAYAATGEYDQLVRIIGSQRNVLTYLPMVYFITALSVVRVMSSRNSIYGGKGGAVERPVEPEREENILLHTDRRHIYWSALILVIAAVLTYSNHFDNSFHFDDAHAVVNNIYIKSLKNIPLFFRDAATFSSLPVNQTYRPVVLTSLALDYALGGGLKPFYFHLSMFLLFLVQGIFMYMLYVKVFGMSLDAGKGAVAALFGVSWYLLHPANAETVNYISARSDTLSTLFGLAGMVLFISSDYCRKRLLYLLPLTVAALAKPIALFFVPLIMLHVYFDASRSPELAGKKRQAHAPFATVIRQTWPALVWAVLMLLLTKAMTPPTYNPSGTAFFNYVITQPYVIFHYFLNFLLPFSLSADTDLAPFASMMDIRFFVGMLFLAGLIFAAFRAARQQRTRPIAYGIAWFLVALLPTSLFPLAEVMNDHRVFFPYIGLAMSSCWFLFLTYERFSGFASNRKVFRDLAVLSACLLLVGYAFGTHERNKVWKTEETLWRDVTVKSPKNGRGLMNYGLALMARGDYGGAEKYFLEALKLTPRYSYLHVNLGVLNSALGKPAEAEQYFRNAISFAPGIPEGYFFYARFLNAQGRLDEAVGNLTKTLELAFAHRDALYLLMDIYARQSNAPKLGELVERALQVAPDDRKALSYREMLKSGRPPASLPPTPVVAKSPEDYLNLSLQHYRNGQFEKSIAAAREALKLKPDYDLAYNNICAAYNELKQWDKAIEAGEQAVKLNPGNQLAKNNLAVAKEQKSKGRK